MTADPISMQEWLSHATPNHPLQLIREEARALVEDATRFAGGVDEWFAYTNERNEYKADEDEWDMGDAA